MILKDKIKVDKNFINELITKSWEESESIQNQIDNIEVDSALASKTVKLLKDLLTSYYIFTGCLESTENEVTDASNLELPTVLPEIEPPAFEEPATLETNTLPEIDNKPIIEPFEYFVDFDEPTGKPLTDADLYN